MSFTRPDMKVRTTSSVSSTAAMSPPSSTASPSTPLSPASPKAPSSSYFGGRRPIRSVTIDTVFSGSRSKSPRPPHELPSASELKHSKTSSASPTARHKSDGAIPITTERQDSFFKPQKKHTGSIGHVGRHSNDWLFGGVSITQTARGLVKGRNVSK